MSAEAHRKEARRDRTAAKIESADARNPYPLPSVTDSSGPSDQTAEELQRKRAEKLDLARQLRQHAREHEAAAQDLEEFEAGQCKTIVPAARAACPLLGPVARMTNVQNGVSVTFATGTQVDAVLAQMRCHFAFAQARGFGAASSCPLYMKGIDIRRGSGPMTIEIIAQEPKLAQEIQARARAEAVLVDRTSR